MKIKRATPANELLAKLIFLILPTVLIGYFLIWNLHQYFGIIGNPESQLLRSLPPVTNRTLQLTSFFLMGMTVSALFHAFRFRFLPVFILLCLGLFSIYKGLDSFSSGEFDAFFISVQFLVFSVLFIAGWITGWGFIRLRYWAVVIAACLLCACILLIAKYKTDTVQHLIQSFAPSLLYAVYIIFTAEQIYNYKDKSQKFWWFLVRRLTGFLILTALIFTGVYLQMRGEIRETVANFGGGGKEGKNSMLNQKKDGTFDLKDYSRLQGSLGRNNELLFCAHIDNFFDGTEIPNPLYLTAFYFTRFDTLTETFERDSTIPFNDLFEPNPSSIPLFFTRTDSSVIKNSLGSRYRKTVNAEIYSKSLSPNTFLAPSTAFFVQPITVEKDFKDQFKSAFRTKSYVSDLNSAYFIYNPQSNAELQKFQEQRFAVLRTAGNYDKMDPHFMNYYTYMPRDAKFQKITALAGKITANATTPVDKVLAIRDWFLSKDENGEPLFKYTDNPGVPDIPSASKLMYFLFENRKGYCAYYAGATLFMLRSLGIPSRIAVGFLTVDRSDKNKGWYWYYADQAHAWVQVYFPGLGWLDFDTTVGNSDARESPKPDGTPPMQPPRAWLAMEGLVEKVDTSQRQLTLSVSSMVFHDEEYRLDTVMQVPLDMRIATVSRDSINVPLSSVKKGEKATAVSYAETFKKMKAGGLSGIALVSKFPKPAPVDEVYLKKTDTAAIAHPLKKEVAKGSTDFKRLLVTGGLITGIILLFILLLPTLVFRYYLLRFHTAKGADKSYWAYKSVLFWLNQLGISRGFSTPMQFARTVVDPRFGTSFTSFMNIYLKQKYAGQPLTVAEQVFLDDFVRKFFAKARQQVMPRKRVAAFLQPMRVVKFYSAKEDSEEEQAG